MTGEAVRWEYKTLVIGETVFSRSPEKKMNELGAQGWELVAVSNVVSAASELYFKRPLPR